MGRLRGPPALHLLQDYTANRETYLRRLRNQHPLEYARLLADIPPDEVEWENRDLFWDWTPEKLVTAREQAKRILDKEAEPLDALVGLYVILDGFEFPEEMLP